MVRRRPSIWGPMPTRFLYFPFIAAVSRATEEACTARLDPPPVTEFRCTHQLRGHGTNHAHKHTSTHRTHTHTHTARATPYLNPGKSVRQEKRGRRADGAATRHRSTPGPTTTADDRSCLNHVPVIPFPPPTGRCAVTVPSRGYMGPEGRRRGSKPPIHALSVRLSFTFLPAPLFRPPFSVPRRDPSPTFPLLLSTDRPCSSPRNTHPSPSFPFPWVYSFSLILSCPPRSLAISLSSSSTRSPPSIATSSRGPPPHLAFSVPFFLPSPLASYSFCRTNRARILSFSPLRPLLAGPFCPKPKVYESGEEG